MKLSIIIPVFNEENTILTILEQIKAVQLPANLTKEIIVVDDGSTDRTQEKLKAFLSTDPFVVLVQDHNQGKGAAVMRGINHSSGEIILIQDADLEYHPDNYAALLQPLLENQTLIVYGSRFKGKIKDMLTVNRWANIFSNWTINALYGSHITDVNTCFKVFSKEVLANITIKTKGFEFETEFTAKLLRRNFKIVEVPISYQARDKQHGKKMNWAKALRMYWALIQYRFYSS